MAYKTVAALIDRDLLAGYTHAQALVLIVLAHHERADGGDAYPSERRLAEMAHTSRNTVRGALALAEQRGLIVAGVGPLGLAYEQVDIGAAILRNPTAFAMLRAFTAAQARGEGT